MSFEDPTDADLLERYLDGRETVALRELIERYQGIVFAAARRQVGRREAAEDVTQAVFLVLIHKAPTLRGHVSLGGWLMKVTRYAAIDALRRESRRRRHEQAAAREREETQDVSSGSKSPAEPGATGRLDAVLDDAIAKLSPPDREAIVMRYFQGKPLTRIAVLVGISDEAARKRVKRAVERLRTRLQAHGVSLPAVSLGPVLLQHATQPLPAGFAIATSPAAVGNGAMIAKGTLAMIAYAKAKTVAVIALAAVMLITGGVLINNQISDFLAHERAKAGAQDVGGHAEAPRPPSPSTPPPVVAVVAAASLPADDAAALYARAAELLVVDGPASSSLLDYPDYPPFGPEWSALAEGAFNRNKPARDLVHDARSIEKADWAAAKARVARGGKDNPFQYLNGLRGLANDAGDAALWSHLQGRDTEALESLRDVLHLSDLLRRDPKTDGLVRLLVATGIDALVSYRLNVISSHLTVTEKADAGGVTAENVQRLIKQLLDIDSTQSQIDAAMEGEPKIAPALQSILTPSLTRSKIAVDRVRNERAFAALSLACQLYRFDHKQWPARADDLAGAYVSEIPIDPFGDGKERLGYVLLPAAEAGGTERPMVYSRDGATGPLFYRTDAPQYGYTHADAAHGPVGMKANGGQFRDVSAWRPAALSDAFEGKTRLLLP